jgi:hypothetical protein
MDPQMAEDLSKMVAFFGTLAFFYAVYVYVMWGSR